MSKILTFIRHNALALLALFIALGGTSYAAFSLPAGSVGTSQLRNGAVTANKLANGSISPSKLDNRTLGGAIRYWAHVAQNGQVLGGSRGTRASLAGVNQYTVTFTRTDGGTVVPPPQTFGCGVLVPHDGNAALSNFPILYASSLQQQPFDALFPYNGGIDRETGKNEIDMKFNITFYGTTVSGKRVQSDTASGLLTFQYSAAAPARAAR